MNVVTSVILKTDVDYSACGPRKIDGINNYLEKKGKGGLVLVTDEGGAADMPFDIYTGAFINLDVDDFLNFCRMVFIKKNDWQMFIQEDCESLLTEVLRS